MSQTSPAGAFLDIRRLTKRYDSFVAIEGIDLSIGQGEFLTLLGPSGSGKTTILMAVAGFIEPDAGEILLRGRNIVPVPAEERDLGVVFQGYALFPHMTVAQNIAFPLELRGVSRGEIRERVRQVLTMTQLSDFAGRRPGQLSGGQQQRVALARCLVYQPDLVLLDEPLSALDRQLRQSLQEELKALHRRLGATIINVTHDQDEALAMSTTIAVMNQGRIVQIGSPGDIYERPASAFVADFVGRANVLALDEVEVGTGPRLCRAGPLTFRVADDRPVPSPAPVLALRPEKIDIQPKGTGPADGRNIIAGMLTDYSYRGSSVTFHTQTPVGNLRVEAPTRRLTFEPKIGLEVELLWAPDMGVIVEAGHVDGKR